MQTNKQHLQKDIGQFVQSKKPLKKKKNLAKCYLKSSARNRHESRKWIMPTQ